MAIIIDEIQLDPKISYGMKAKIQYAVTVLAGQTGIEQRLGRRSRPIRSYVFDKLLKKAQFDDLREFFMARGGNLHGFRFKDWSDYSVTDEELVNDGLTDELQLIKTYPDTIRAQVRNIEKPIAPITMKKNGASFVDFTLDDETGLVTLTAGPQAGTFTWTGEFDTPVRFQTDEFEFVQVATNQYDCLGLSIIELLSKN